MSIKIIEKTQQSTFTLKEALNQMHHGITETFKTSFLNYAELLASSINDTAKLAEAVQASKQIVEAELKTFNASFEAINTKIDTYLKECMTELEAQKKHRQKEEEALAKIEKDLYHYE